MVSIPKVAGVLSWGVLLCLGLSNAAQAATEDDTNVGQVDKQKRVEEDVHVLQGDVLRVEGTNYVVKRLDGKVVSVHTDNTTVKTGTINAGDRIETKVNEQDHALSILLVP